MGGAELPTRRNANLRRNVPNQTSSPFLPQLRGQLADAQAFLDDALQRGWGSEIARDARLITSIQRDTDRLQLEPPSSATP